MLAGAHSGRPLALTHAAAQDRRASGFGDVTFGGGDMRYRGGGGGGMNASGWASPAPMGGGRSGMMQTPGGGAG